MMKSFSRTLTLIVAASGILFGQMRSTPIPVPLADQVNALGGTSILDPARFSMQHGLSFSMQTGAFGMAQGVGVYSNTMSYLLSEAMAITSEIHLVQPTMGSLPGMPAEVSVYYQTALDWQLTPNINLKFGLSNMPRYNRYNQGYSPFSNMNRRGMSIQRDSLLGQ